MDSSSHYADLARHAIQPVLDGNPPNGTRPEDCGPWATVVDGVFKGYASGSTDRARKVFNTLAAADRNISKMMVDSDMPIKAAAPQPGSFCPELPEPANAVYEHLAPCGFWLEEYIGYALRAAPMTPRVFHEAAGLFAASMAIARRLYCQRGTKPLYPNLYFLFVSPSTIDHKSTGLHVLQSVIRDAGISHLLMPRKATPAALVADLDYSKLPTPRQMLDKDSFLLRRAFAAQRGWIRDEASALFASLKQEFNAGLLELILELYDCPDDYDDLTISRSETRIERAYLSFFGVSTPAEMGTHFSNLNYWSNGLWARCLVLTPEERTRDFQFFPQNVGGGGMVVQGLQQVYKLFPKPAAALETIEHDHGKPETVVRITSAAQPQPAMLGDGVWEAWEAYAQATGHTLLLDRAVEEELYACYGRFGDLAMKVAILLSAMDAEHTPVTVELRHFAAAQQRVEGWRVGLHRLWSSQSATNETRLMDRVLKRLERAGPSGTTVRDLCISLRQTAKEVSEALTLLSKAGRAINEQLKAANGRSVDLWRCP